MSDQRPTPLTAEQEVWLRAWIAVANAETYDPATAERWAERALNEFRRLWPKENQNQQA